MNLMFRTDPSMKGVYEVLRSKEHETEKLETEIQTLRIAAPAVG
jgi:hypothetical protein